MTSFFCSNLFLLLADLLHCCSDRFQTLENWRVRTVPAGIERIVDGEEEVVGVHLDQGGGQHLAAAEGPDDKLVGLEFKPTAQSLPAEFPELQKTEKVFKFFIFMPWSEMQFRVNHAHGKLWLTNKTEKLY